MTGRSSVGAIPISSEPTLGAETLVGRGHQTYSINLKGR